MVDKPMTIEEKMREVPSFERTEHGENAVWAERTIFGDAILREDAIRIAREHAEARARPYKDLVEGLERLLVSYRVGRIPAEATFVKIAKAKAQIAAAEAQHRGDAKQSAEGGR